jgi:tetratricopeptide (TPR) repeat protein
MTFKTIVKGIGHSLAFLLTRGAFLYFLLFVLAFRLFNVQGILERRQTEVLNEIMPSFGYISQYAEKEGPFDPARLEAYLRYYHKVDEYLPNSADVLATLGFLYHYQGQEDKAIDYYEKAVEINPHIFWFYHNIGVIYYKQGKYARAIPYLQKAINKKPELALAFAGYSRVYRRISHNVANYKDMLQQRIESGYADSFALMVLAYIQTGDFAQALPVAVYGYQNAPRYKKFFLYHAGFAAFKIQEYKKAVYFFKEFLKIDPNYRDALFHLAVSLKKLGADPLAQMTMQKALMLGEDTQTPLLQEQDIMLRLF